MTAAVGVLGGAFNPPHIGHLLLAQEAIGSLDLDELVLVPTGVAAHKRIEPEPGPGIRLEMTRRAVAGADRMRASAVEVDRDGPSFAYRTLELLSDELPGSELIFLMGADVAAGLGSWRRPERVLELARVAIAEREGVRRSDVDSTLAELGATERAEVISMPPVGISSSLVRERIASGRGARWMVPDPVLGLIEERGLYAKGAVAG